MRKIGFYKATGTIRNWIAAFPLNPFAFVQATRGLFPALRDYSELKRQNRKAGNLFKIHFSNPQLRDRFESGGTAKEKQQCCLSKLCFAS